jgi:hypothetical protein
MSWIRVAFRPHFSAWPRVCLSKSGIQARLPANGFSVAGENAGGGDIRHCLVPLLEQQAGNIMLLRTSPHIVFDHHPGRLLKIGERSTDMSILPESPANHSETQGSSTLRFIPLKPVRRRAAQACVPCRNRKVRCDFALHTPAPCTNCRLDGTVCEVTKSKRRR